MQFSKEEAIALMDYFYFGITEILKLDHRDALLQEEMIFSKVVKKQPESHSYMEILKFTRTGQDKFHSDW